MKKINIKQSIIKFSDFLFVMLLIMSSNSIYYTSAERNYYISELLIFSVIFMLIIRLLFDMIDVKKLSIAFSFLTFYVLFMGMFSLININKNFYNFFCIFIVLFSLCYLIYKTARKEERIINRLLKMYTDIVLCIAIFSLIMYIIGPTLNIIKPTGYFSIQWGGIKNNYSYFNIYFVRQTEKIFGKIIFRNTSIFTEAPMYSLILTIALASEVFLLNRRNKKRILIFVITIITTISTTGIIISSLIIGTMFIKENETNKVIGYIKIIFLPILIFILAYTSFYFFNAKKDSNSYNTRIDDYKASFLAWKDHPIFGNGYGNNEVAKGYMSAFRSDNKGLSNSIMVVLAQGGVILFSFYFIAVFRVWKYSRNINVKLFLIVMIILFITTIFQYMPLLINFMAISYALSKDGYTQRENIKINIKQK